MVKKNKILTVFGTRPEAIKLAPVVKALAQENSVVSKVCVTGQHREMLDQVLGLFKINPNYDLNLMKRAQNLNYLSTTIIQGIQKVIDEYQPNILLVQGDTTTTFAASLCAFHNNIKVAHLEAGLRTGDPFSPWPEEANRRMASVISSIHLAPTQQAKKNLIKESFQERNIYIVGNTVIDSLLFCREKISKNRNIKKRLEKKFSFLNQNKKTILVTCHRRESFGKEFLKICEAIRDISKNKDLQIVFPVHLNPNVQKPVKQVLKNIDNIFLIEPQSYLEFIYLMDTSYLILTDSGGVQEEAPSLGKPVLLLRKNTERPEAVEVGAVKIVGTSKSKILESVEELLNNTRLYKKMSKTKNPYGDGKSSLRICKILSEVRV